MPPQQPGGWGPPPAWGGGPAWESVQAPKPGVVPLRPLGFGEILDGAFTTVQRYPKILLGMSTAVMTVMVVIGYLTLFVGFGDIVFADDTEILQISDSTWVSFAVSMFALLLLIWVGSTALTGMITVTVGRGVLGRPATVAEVWRTGRVHIPRLIGLTFLVGLVATIGAAVLIALVVLAFTVDIAVGVPVAIVAGVGAIIGYAFVATRWVAAAPALVLETRPTDPAVPWGDQNRIGVVASLRRSWTLISGRTLRTFAIIFVANLIANVVSSIVQVAFTILATFLAFALGQPTGGDSPPILVLIVGGIGYVASIVLVVAFISSVNALVYVDARMRSEGLDIELAQASAARPGAVSPWTAR